MSSNVREQLSDLFLKGEIILDMRTERLIPMNALLDVFTFYKVRSVPVTFPVFTVKVEDKTLCQKKLLKTE